MKALAVGGLALGAAGLAFIVVLFLPGTSPESDKDEERTQAGQRVKSKPDPAVPFLPKGWQVTGRQETILRTINLPFLHGRLIGKKAIVVSIKGAGVSFKRATSTYRNAALTVGKVTVLAETGQLVRIELSGKNAAETFPGQMSLADAEERYRSTGETYEALPQKAPALPFQEVLENVYGRSVNEIEKAKRVEAAYVVESVASIRKGQPMWLVNFFGCPPYPARGIAARRPDSPEWRAARSHLRYLVDTRGKVLEADNRP